jgi:hypothetical protein
LEQLDRARMAAQHGFSRRGRGISRPDSVQLYLQSRDTA